MSFVLIDDVATIFAGQRQNKLFQRGRRYHEFRPHLTDVV